MGNICEQREDSSRFIFIQIIKALIHIQITITIITIRGHSQALQDNRDGVTATLHGTIRIRIKVGTTAKIRAGTTTKTKDGTTTAVIKAGAVEQMLKFVTSQI